MKRIRLQTSQSLLKIYPRVLYGFWLRLKSWKKSWNHVAFVKANWSTCQIWQVFRKKRFWAFFLYDWI